MPTRSRVVSRVVKAALLLLTVLGMVVVGCGGSDPAPEVTAAENLSKANQGKHLRDLFAELDLEVEWDNGANKRPPTDDFNAATGGIITDENGTKIAFLIQLTGPGSQINIPAEGPLITGYLAEGNIRGGPSFSFWPLGDEDDFARPMPNESEGDLIIRMAEGLCIKFAGRECGEPDPTTDV